MVWKPLSDFVPNHVARQYKSDAKPAGVKILKAMTWQKHSRPQTYFIICPTRSFNRLTKLCSDQSMLGFQGAQIPYIENQLKATATTSSRHRPINLIGSRQ